MTKYILAGGFIHRAPDGGQAFCQELVAGFGQGRPVKILNCLFARNPESWADKLLENREYFSRYLDNFELILADPERFTAQVKEADVILLQGGYTRVLMEKLLNNPDWTRYLDGKTVAGSSAGGEVIAKYYCVLKTGRIGDGLGLLPIKFVPHWQADYADDEVSDIDWQAEYQKIKEYQEDLPIYTLTEGQFVVFNG